MKPSEVAALLGIASSTIRAWSTGEFRPYFSPSAQGGSGRFRNLTDTDIRLLHFINTLKRESVPADEIHLRLKTAQRDNWDSLPPLPEAPPNVASVPMLPTAAADAALSSERRSMLREIAKLEERVEKLEGQLEAERERREGLLKEESERRAELTRQLAKAETELDMWRSGRLKPE